MIKCGLSEMVITPAFGLSIPGYLLDRKATGLKDDLFVKAMVLENDSGIAAIVSLDAIAIDKEDVKEIRRRIFELTGIPKSNVMVCATHTHTGSPVISIFNSRRDDEYVSLLIKKSGDAVACAYKNMQPVKIGFGVGKEESIAFNRRFIMKDGSLRTNPGRGNQMIVRPAGPIDADVAVMRIDKLDGEPLGVITNYACHLDCLGGDEYSADYPGELSRYLKQLYGQHFISIFLTGACGNINHIDVVGSDKLHAGHYKRMGRILAGEVIKTREKIDTLESMDISIKHVNIQVSTREPSEQELKDAKAAVEKGDINSNEYIFGKSLLDYLKTRKEYIDIEVQILCIGDLCITGLPGEIFVEFGFDIKTQSPYKYNMISTLTNGSNGYVNTKESIVQGTYEAIYNGYTVLDSEAGYQMVSGVKGLWEK